jgi:arsenate reductase
MDEMQMFHNPSCSKSRGALQILKERNVDVDVVEYLEAPPDKKTLERIVDSISDPPAALVRHDNRFKELGLDPKGYTTKQDVVALLLEHPELMERPVIFKGDRAVIARPSERVLDLL